MLSSLEFIFSSSRRKPAAKVNNEALGRKIKQGSEREFSRLYNVHVQELFNYGMHICDDPEFMKSCLQELFVRVWDQHHDLSVAISVKSYLFGSFRKLLSEKIPARNSIVRSITFSRRQFEFKLLPSDDVFGDHVVSNFDNEQKIQGITGRQAEALFLKIHARFSYHEVASVMGLNVSTIYNLVFASVENLRQRMRIIPQLGPNNASNIQVNDRASVSILARAQVSRL
jgi:DNA-directed RNA polymerase specialized sigma24 family protein